MILAGRLTGTLDGRPVVIKAGEAGLLLSFAAFPSAWRARKMLAPLRPALVLLRDFGVPLRLQVAGLVSVAVFPRANAVVKFLVPGLRGLD